ncbi:uncharacterized protein [Nyctibius grandis]|uniref:uncharacterized protein n=1 Tax=Nyctibius grandis TaxID=48427 RepID=UPI0035BC548C
MEVWLAGGFLPLLLLAWLPAGLACQVPAMIDVSVGLDLILECLLQTGSSSTARNVTWFNTTQNGGEKHNEGGVEINEDSAQLIFTGVNEAHTGSYVCRMETPRETPRLGYELNHHGIVLQPEKSVTTVECRFNIWSENLVVHVKWYKFGDLEVGNQTNITALEENCTNPTSPGARAADTTICGCRVFITRTNLPDTGNVTQGTVPSCSPVAPQTNATEKETWTGLDFPLCIIFGLVIGTALYMPVIGFLLWRCGRSGKGTFTSRQVAEGNQLSTAAPGTENLTYVNLKFEQKGTKPSSSDIVYTEIKPSQQKQSDQDAGAANAGVDASPEEEGK